MKKVDGFILSVIVFLIIAVGVYITVFSKYQNILNERKTVYERFCNINSQIDDFSNILKRMDGENTKLKDILSVYEDYFITNTEIINTYKSRIEPLFKQYEIPVEQDTITQVQSGDKNISLVLKFKAGYDQIYQLLFDIEKISTVSDIQISYKGDVSFKCTPNLYSQEVDDYFMGRVEQSMDEFTAKGYFKSISDKIISELEIGYIPTWRDLFPVPRNPLYPGFVKKKKVVKKKSAVAAPVVQAKALPSDITLEGVMFEANEPIAIIDGKLLRVGDVHKGATLVGIKQNFVQFEYYGKTYTVRMDN